VYVRETDGTPSGWVKQIQVDNNALTVTGADAVIDLSGAAGGSAITFDIEDDGGNDSTDLSEIATDNDTNSIFTEPSADKMLIDLSKDWPKADAADIAYDVGLTGDGDFGDFDVKSIDGLYGVDDQIYIDMGTNGVLTLEADTSINITAPTDVGDEDITSIDKLEGYDAAVYIDMGADGTIAIEADTAINLSGPMDFDDEDVTSVDKLEGVDNAIYVDLGADTIAQIEADGKIQLGAPDVEQYEATNDANPEYRQGGADAEESVIQTVFDSGAQTVDYLLIKTETADATADEGRIIFQVDEQQTLQVDDGGIEVGANGVDGTLKLYSEQGGTDYGVVFTPHTTMTETTTYKLPAADGTASQYLYTDGSGQLAWGDPTGSGDITAVGDGASGAVFTADGAGETLYFEGSSANDYEILLTSDNPGADCTVTLPDQTGHVLLGASAGYTDNTLIRANGSTSHLTQGTGITVDDSNNVASMGTLGCGAITTTGTITAGSGAIAITDATGNVDGSKIADADLGVITFSSGAVTIDDGTVVPADLADDDFGDFSVSSGSATLDADVVAAAEMADADHGDVTWASGVANVDVFDITGASTVADNITVRFGGAATDYFMEFAEGDEDTLSIYTTDTASTGTDNGMITIAVDTGNAGCTANQEVFEIGRGGQDDGDTNFVELFSVDEDGDVYYAGTATAAPSEDPGVVLNEITAGDTDWWFGINADQSGDDDDDFELGIGLTIGTNTKWAVDNSGNTVAQGNATADAFIMEGGTYDTTIDPGTPTESVTYQWPLADGTSGQVLATNASGVMSWTTVTATPAGSNYHVQWNNGTALDSEAAFTYNDDNNTLSITQSATNPTLQIGDGTYSWNFTPQVGIEGFLEVDSDIAIEDDLYLDSDSAVTHWGEDGDVTVTHDPDDGLFVKSIATGDNNPFVLTVQTGETDIAADDVLGGIYFQAPDEATGTDAILVAAGIEAVSEGDFAADSNATKLSFQTGASEVAAEKMSLSSAGNLTVSGDVAITGDDLNMGADPAEGGAINLGNATVIAWEDATECTLTHVDNTGLTCNLQIQGATVTDGTVTLAGDGTITGISAGGLPDDSIVDADIDQDGTFSLTGDWTVGNLTAGTLTANTIDTTGAADIDIGSADVTDVTITTDGGADSLTIGNNADLDFGITFDSDTDDATINWDEDNSELEINAPNYRFGANADEDIVITLDSDTEDAAITWDEDNGELEFGAIDLLTTGSIQGAVKINSDADGMSQGEMTAVGMYGSMFFATGAGTWNLPAAAAGMSFCLYSTGANAIIINPDDGDTITYDGTKDTAGHQIASPSAAGDFISMVALDATDWYVLGHSGTWVPGS
jgi:hypothetical protein